MVRDVADVPAGPESLDSVRVVFDEERLISDAGLLVGTATRSLLSAPVKTPTAVRIPPSA